MKPFFLVDVDGHNALLYCLEGDTSSLNPWEMTSSVVMKGRNYTRNSIVAVQPNQSKNSLLRRHGSPFRAVHIAFFVREGVDNAPPPSRQRSVSTFPLLPNPVTPAVRAHQQETPDLGLP